MKNIELPTYRCIIPNEVFEKTTAPVNVPDVGNVEVSKVARITRFRTPTKEETIDFIVAVAKGNLQPFGPGIPFEEELTAGKYLKHLPDFEVGNIATRDRESLDHLRRHYPESNLQEGRFYVKTSTGIIPNRILNQAGELLKEEGSEVYKRAIEKTGIKKVDLSVRLLENGSFPNSLELEYLLDRGVRVSDVFSVTGDFEDYKEVANQLRLLYNTLSSPKIISQIRDSSYNFLDGQAAFTVQGTIECIQKGMMKKGIAEMIGEAVKAVEGEINGKGKTGHGGFYAGGSSEPCLN